VRQGDEGQARSQEALDEKDAQGKHKHGKSTE